VRVLRRDEPASSCRPSLLAHRNAMMRAEKHMRGMQIARSQGRGRMRVAFQSLEQTTYSTVASEDELGTSGFCGNDSLRRKKSH
jgi:hypothetical protein